MSPLPSLIQMIRPSNSIYVVIALPSLGLAMILFLVGQPTQVAAFLFVILALILSISRHRLMWNEEEVVYRRIFSTVQIKRSLISSFAVSSRKPLIPIFPLSSYVSVFSTESESPVFSINLALFSPQDMIRFTDYVQQQQFKV